MAIQFVNPLESLLFNLITTTRFVLTIISAVEFYILFIVTMVHQLGKVLKIVLPSRSKVLDSLTAVDTKRKRTLAYLWTF